MKQKLMVLFLLAGSTMFAGTRFVVGFGVPVPVPAPVVTYAAPYPAPVVTYAPGPYYRGYWGRPPYAGAVWVGPRWFGGHYYRGYWRR